MGCRISRGRPGDTGMLSHGCSSSKGIRHFLCTHTDASIFVYIYICMYMFFKELLTLASELDRLFCVVDLPSLDLVQRRKMVRGGV